MKRERRGCLRAGDGGWVGGGGKEDRKKRRTIGMKWTVVKASASLSIKQSGGDDLLSQGEQGLCSVCILYVFWWSCGPYRGVFLKNEIIITLRVGERSGWSLQIETSDSRCIPPPPPPFILFSLSRCLLSLIVSHVLVLPFCTRSFTFCLFSPRWPSLSPPLSARMLHGPSLHPASPSRVSPSPLAPFLPSPRSLSPPWSQIMTAPPPPPDTGGVEAGGQRRGGLCSQIDLCSVHQRMSPGRSLPRLNSMRDTLICHALACMATPAKTPSWRPSQLPPYSLNTRAWGEKNRHKMAATVTALFSEWVKEEEEAVF